MCVAGDAVEMIQKDENDNLRVCLTAEVTDAEVKLPKHIVKVTKSFVHFPRAQLKVLTYITYV